MEGSRLVQYISLLSDEDRKKFKPLIEDALRRDKVLARFFHEANRHAERYEENSIRLVKTAKDFHASLLRLNEKLAEVAETAERVLEPAPRQTNPGIVSTLRH